MSRTLYHRSARNEWHHAGFTLVELMISMAIGLFILLALATVLVNVIRSNSEQGKSNTIVDSGRYALQLLASDLGHAGFLGGHVPQYEDLSFTATPSDVPADIPDPCLAFTTPWDAAYKTNLIGIPVQGYEIPATVPSPTLSVCASLVVSPKANTDVLFVRHLESCIPGVGSCTAVAENDLYFQVNRCRGTGGVAPSPAYAFEQYPAAPTPSPFTLQNRDCGTTLADLRRFMSTLYYVRNYAVTAGDGIPTLMRSQFGISGGVPQHKAAEVLIPGVEGFRVEYGIDDHSDSGATVNFGAALTWADTTTKTSPTNRGDGIPDGSYIRCTTATPCTAAQLVNAVAVKVYVLMRSETPSAGYTDTKTYNLGSTTLGPFNDAYKRHMFTQTVRLTNVSSRRETPS